jgi:hypothetical protein
VLVRQGQITEEDAMMSSLDKDDLRKNLVR